MGSVAIVNFLRAIADNTDNHPLSQVVSSQAAHLNIQCISFNLIPSLSYYLNGSSLMEIMSEDTSLVSDSSWVGLKWIIGSRWKNKIIDMKNILH